jgi:hypothetical protein
MFGQIDVTFTGDFTRFGTVQSVKVGGANGINLRAGATSLTVTLQGSPSPGAAAVGVTGVKRSPTNPGAFQ